MARRKRARAFGCAVTNICSHSSACYGHGVPGPYDQRVISGYPLRLWWLGASAALIIIGSFGPWARALFVSVSGTDGDGVVTLLGGVAAVVAAFLYARTSTRPRPWWPIALCLAVAVVGVAITANVWWDLESSDGADESSSTSEDEFSFDFDTDALVTVSWGLILTLVASISLAVAAGFNFIRRGVVDVASPSEPSQSETQGA